MNLQTFDPFTCSREQNFPPVLDPGLLRIVSSTTEDFELCKAEIAQLKERRTRLKEEQTIRTQYLDACLCLTRPSPIRTLPLEILSQIFEHCCPSPVLICSDGSCRIEAMMLARVCSRWRFLVLSSPALFSNLSFILDSGDSDWAINKVTEFTPIILGRSESGCISLNIEAYRWSDHRDWATIISFVEQCLAPHAARMSHINIPAFLLPLSQQFTILESLVLDFDEAPEDPTFSIPELPRADSPIDLRTLAPDLWSLEISGCQDALLTANWESLRSITFTDCTPQYIMQTIPLCKGLTSICFQNQRSRKASSMSSLPDNQEVTVLRHLTTLTLDSCDTPFTLSTLQFLALPSLKAVNISQQEGCYALSMLTRLDYSITSFKLALAPSLSHTMSRVVKYLPSLTTLSLVLRPYPNNPHCRGKEGLDVEGMYALFAHLHEPNLPALRTLDLDLEIKYDTKDFDASKFVTMVQSRWYTESGTRTLESVSLRVTTCQERSGPIFDEAFWTPLKEMQQEGLRIHVDDSLGCVRTRVEAKAGVFDKL